MNTHKPDAAILLVDDDGDILETLGAQLACEGYSVTTCLDPEEAIVAIRQREFAVIITDQNMPKMTGLELLAQVRDIQPNTSRVLITGLFGLDTLIGAINEGEIFRFLAKPWTRLEMLATVGNAVHRYRILGDNDRLRAETLALNEDLEEANATLRAHVAQLTVQKEQLDESHHALTENFEHSLGLCHRIINTFYPLLGTRTKAVVEICRRMTESNDLSAEEKHVLMTSAWLHDIGLVGVKREALHKLFHHPADCTEEDWAMIHQHPGYGQTLASFVDRLTTVGATIRGHHERYDGKGYPDGLAGEAIPWTAQCLAVAVAFVETGLPKTHASEFIVQQSGIAFHPDAVRLFFKATQAQTLPRQIRELTLGELEPGMSLAKGIYSPAGLLLIPEGQALTTATLAKIRNHNMLAHVTQRLLVYS
ncbi:MAG: response regulator [Chthoniobacter sp.]|nr:response regulator [Chthoniobacter sp.]